jgi:hypothetical protein
MKNRNPLTSKTHTETPRWFSINRFFSILRIASGGALLSAATAMGLMAVLSGPSIATADDPSHAVYYYVALGDSLAEGFQPNGDVGPDGMFMHGYANQLYDALKANEPTQRQQIRWSWSRSTQRSSRSTPTTQYQLRTSKRHSRRQTGRSWTAFRSTWSVSASGRGCARSSISIRTPPATA